jgi:hypothetical protein
MAVAIPEYRLPKKILQAEIDNILKLGVELKLNTRVNDIDSLFKEGYKAVFISCGAHKGDKMGIPGEAVEGVYDAIEFLREMNLGKKLKVGKRVAVVGGGNSAMDAARVALRQGAEEVHILYRRERRDMPAIEEEIEAAEEEGIHVDCLTAPTKVLSQNGKLTGLECVRMELKGFDSSGRRYPEPDCRLGVHHISRHFNRGYRTASRYIIHQGWRQDSQGWHHHSRPAHPSHRQARRFRRRGCCHWTQDSNLGCGRRTAGSYIHQEIFTGQAALSIHRERRL